MKHLPTLIPGLVVLLVGCGGGGGSTSSGMIRPDTPDAEPPPTEISGFLYRPEHASQSPRLNEMIGTPFLSPPLEALSQTTWHESSASHVGSVPIWTGIVADGTSRTELISYLSADIAASDGTLNRFVSPPVVHFSANASAEDVDATLQAIQHINESLPPDWQLRVSNTPTAKQGAGEILMMFEDTTSWTGRVPASCHSAIACADVQTYTNPTGAIRGATVFVNQGRRDDSMYVAWLAHELMHTLGRRHADPQRFPQSIMVPEENLGLVVTILDTLDRDALFAVYDMLEAGDTSSVLYESLDAWESESFHVMTGYLFGEDLSSNVSFGVADRNDRQSAWVLGTRSPTALNSNPSLVGSASWDGRMLGMTPSARIVAGDAGLVIDLDTLTGDLAFTGLEQWAEHTNPGEVGTGTRWGDGNLRYDIELRDSIFWQTGIGDTGVVTGQIIGTDHQAMGGTLERSDVTAAFGGLRN